MVLAALFITAIHFAPAFLISSSKEASGVGKGAWVVAALVPALFHKKLAVLEGSPMTISVIALLLAWGTYAAFMARGRTAAS